MLGTRGRLFDRSDSRSDSQPRSTDFLLAKQNLTPSYYRMTVTISLTTLTMRCNSMSSILSVPFAMSIPVNV